MKKEKTKKRTCRKYAAAFKSDEVLQFNLVAVPGNYLNY